MRPSSGRSTPARRLVVAGEGPGADPAGNRSLVLLLLIAAVLLAYQPAWNGGFLWDDEGHVTREGLRSASGLLRIWFSPGATQQYYPVLHSVFWLLHQIWGSATLGYHLTNIALHALSASFLFVLLRRLSVPGALLAAFIFALHPVHVESVAWISELKNVLSGAFYLAAALAYLRYHDSRKAKTYAVALGLFTLAVLSKTVTVTFPVAMLVVLWWRDGRLRLREDVAPLAPFAAVGLIAGLVTIWFERTLIGAQGEEFALTFLERCLLAGRVVWFYAMKIVWPTDLMFVYPRWTIDAASPAQWTYLAALLASGAAFWLLRSRTRVPLASLLFFCATLFPALGFFDVYPFRYSYVADHFQYLASLGVIVPIAAALASLGGRVAAAPRQKALWAAPLVALLGVITWRHAHSYADSETLYRATISRNAEAWFPRNNLAALLLQGDPRPEQVDEAAALLREAIRLKPGYVEAHYNLGTALERQGRINDAEEEYGRVLALDPGQPRVLQRLAAIAHDRASDMLAQGLQLEDAGRLEEAERAYQSAVRLDPARPAIYRALGRVLQKQQRREDAIAAYLQVLPLDPSSFETHNDLGVLYAQAGNLHQAVRHFETAVRLRPDDAGARANLSRAQALLRAP
jgi:tetratricopeptide (TPR) repeat protein